MKFRFKVSILFLVCLLTRLYFAGRYLDSCDSINFAMGLHDYDLSLFQPHFPGYPVYLFTSWLFLKLSHHDVWALVLPATVFGSLTLCPISSLVKNLFSERIAVLTAILYIINPLCWLQAERPVSDAMGLFFVFQSASLLLQAIKTGSGGYNRLLYNQENSYKTDFQAGPVINKNSPVTSLWLLFLGSLVLGIGLGVRLSYFPFVVLWIGAIIFMVMRNTCGNPNIILSGMAGFVCGICLWFIPQIGLTGWTSFLYNGISFSYGHFTQWGGSVITYGGLERIMCLIKSIWIYGLGAWWSNLHVLRLILSAAIIISILYPFVQIRYREPVGFLGMFILPYILWVSFGQNSAHPRHMLPVIPVILVFIANGLDRVYKDRNRIASFFLTGLLFIGMLVVSLRSVIQYHTSVPPPVQVIQFIQNHFHNLSTRIYCSEEKRFFDYYVPLWDAREIRNLADLNRDLRSSLSNPSNILLLHAGEITGGFNVKNVPLRKFERNPYAAGIKDDLILFDIIR